MFMGKCFCAFLLAVVLLVAGNPVNAASGRDTTTMISEVATLATSNEDTVGLLYLPGTTVFHPVVQGPKDDKNQYYLRRNFEGNVDLNGCLFADYRCTFLEDLGGNTVIYGNSTADVSRQNEMFDQLKRYLKESFCEENPILYFATREKLTTWQIFAVSIMTTDSPYNRPDLDQKEWAETLAAVRDASLHDFSDIDVRPEDRVLTLSTPDYSLSDAPFSNNRLVIMAREMKPTTPVVVAGAVGNNPQTGH
jgi:sortase B